MKCPFCGDADTQVIDSRVNDEGDSIRRRRKCGKCDKRFTTYETADLHLPQVVKTNGTREEFSRDKLRLSFTRALHKRPVPTEYVERALDHIVQKMLSLGEREIPARALPANVEVFLADVEVFLGNAEVFLPIFTLDRHRNISRPLNGYAPPMISFMPSMIVSSSSSEAVPIFLPSRCVESVRI